MYVRRDGKLRMTSQTEPPVLQQKKHHQPVTKARSEPHPLLQPSDGTDGPKSYHSTNRRTQASLMKELHEVHSDSTLLQKNYYLAISCDRFV